jgi:hypothetical protein
MNANIIARIANNLFVSGLNNTGIVRGNTSGKVNTIAQAVAHFTRSARLAAASLFAVGSLVALSQTSRADIVIDQFVGPQQVYSYDNGQLVAAAGVTAVQVKLRNTDTTTVSGITVQIYAYLAEDVNNGWTVRAMPALTNQTLGPDQSKWLTIAIPKMSRQNFSLYNRNLWIKAVVGSQVAWVQNALDRPADNVVPGIAQLTSGQTTFTITFTNTGNQNAPAKSVTVRATPSNSSGPVVALSSVVPQTLSLPALGAHTSTTLTFTMPTRPTDSNNYAEFCALDIVIADPLIGYQVESSGQVYY